MSGTCIYMGGFRGICRKKGVFGKNTEDKVADLIKEFGGKKVFLTHGHKYGVKLSPAPVVSEAKKRGADAATRQGIYERYAAQDTSKADTVKSVSEALGDSSGEATVSIYDRYKSVESSSSADAAGDDSAAGAAAPAAGESDTASVDAGAFQ